MSVNRDSFGELVQIIVRPQFVLILHVFATQAQQKKRVCPRKTLHKCIPYTKHVHVTGVNGGQALNYWRMPADSHLLCCEKFWLSKFGCTNQTESQPGRRALKNSTAWVNESGRSRGKSELDNKVLSLCLSIKPRTMAKPEVGLKDNGLGKHYYLNRSPPPQFTGQGKYSRLGSDSPYKTTTTTIQ